MWSSIKACGGWYNRMLKERPFWANMWSSMVISFCGDIAAQHVRRTPRDAQQSNFGSSALQLESPFSDRLIDLRRSFLFSSFSVIWTPFFLTVLPRLDKIVLPPMTPFKAVKKGFLLWCAQSGVAPFFITYVALAERYFISDRPSTESALSTAHQRIASDLVPLATYSLLLYGTQWIPLFYLTPPHLRLVYTSVTQLCGGTIASYILHRNE